MNTTLDELLKTMEPELKRVRRDLHHHAEPGWGEYRTASLVAQRLSELGFSLKIGREVVDEHSRMALPSPEVMEQQYKRALSEGAVEKYAQKMKGGFTGVVGEIENGEGPTLGFRFDMDAVEMEELHSPGHLPAKEGFASIHPEAMHSCGHDGHTTIGLGVAEVLSRMKDRLRGRVKLIFQPAEEGVRGARAMVAAGVVDDVDYMFGMHIGMSARSTGELYCGTDGFLATSKFDAYFSGAPTHAGLSPEEGKNALLSAAAAITNLHAIPRHGGGPTRINVGRISAGSGRNVIPADAHLAIETRGKNTELNSYMKDYAKRIIKSAAEMHGNGYRIVEMGEAESASSDEQLMGRVYRIADAHGVFPKLHQEKANLGGSEDYTHMMKRVTERGGKATFLMLGSDLKGHQHTAEFDFEEKILLPGIKILSLIALELEHKEHDG